MIARLGPDAELVPLPDGKLVPVFAGTGAPVLDAELVAVPDGVLVAGPGWGARGELRLPSTMINSRCAA